MLRSIPFHLDIYLSQSNAFSHVAIDAYSCQSVNFQEIFNAYQYRIYKLDFCFNNFHIFRFSRSGKREAVVNSFMSNYSSDYNALFFVTIPCYNSPSMRYHARSLAILSCEVKFLNEEKSSLHKLVE